MLIRPHKIPKEYSASTDTDNRQLTKKAGTKQRKRMLITKSVPFLLQKLPNIVIGAPDKLLQVKTAS